MHLFLSAHVTNYYAFKMRPAAKPNAKPSEKAAEPAPEKPVAEPEAEKDLDIRCHSTCKHTVFDHVGLRSGSGDQWSRTPLSGSIAISSVDTAPIELERAPENVVSFGA